jgi:hypothetical protein
MSIEQQKNADNLEILIDKMFNPHNNMKIIKDNWGLNG